MTAPALREAAHATTYLAHAQARSAAHGPGPWPDGGYPLPDVPEPQLMAGSVWDGVRTHHSSFEVDIGSARRVADRIRQQEVVALQALHDDLADIDTLTIADALGGELRGQSRGRIHEIGKWLACNGTRRNAVAAGVVLIGLSGTRDDCELLLLLGSMEELTLYAVVALGRIARDDDRDWMIFELARRVRAWGRIHSVERLKGTRHKEIKAWLLREGFRNGVLNGYLAHLAATTGELRRALEEESEVDDDLLDGAGDILSALCEVGGPAKDITDYPDGPAVISRYLTLVRDRPTLSRVRAVLALDGHLEHDNRTRSLLTDLDWLATVQKALDSNDLNECAKAIWPAKKLGLRFQDRLGGWLTRDPVNIGFWHSLDDVGEVADLAPRLLPLRSLATGPADDNGVGPDRAADRALEIVVSKFTGHPGRGWPLVKTALSNRVICNRNAAVRVLQAWPRDSLPDDAKDAVAAAARREPVKETKAAMTRLLKAWTA